MSFHNFFFNTLRQRFLKSFHQFLYIHSETHREKKIKSFFPTSFFHLIFIPRERERKKKRERKREREKKDEGVAKKRL